MHKRLWTTLWRSPGAGPKAQGTSGSQGMCRKSVQEKIAFRSVTCVKASGIGTETAGDGRRVGPVCTSRRNRGPFRRLVITPRAATSLAERRVMARSGGLAGGAGRALRPAVGMDLVDHGRDRLGRGELGYPVAQVEDVAVPCGGLAIVVEHPADLAADLLGFGHQAHGIEVALQRDAPAHEGARPAEIARPVETERIGPDVGEIVEPLAAALGEDDDRHV